MLSNPSTWVQADSLGLTMLLMVVLLMFVIGRFSATYLEGESRRRAFLTWLGATALAVAVLVVSNHLALFWVAWVSTSVCLHQLLTFYPERPRARLAARKKFVVARLGDALLAVAFALLYVSFDTADISEIGAGATPGSEFGQPPGTVTAAAVLIGMTALLKSAQFPTHGWLIDVVETPTPVSALLHAGVLNAGPFVVLRFAGIVHLSPASACMLMIVGGFTAAFASVVLRTQPSVKIALGYSSAAHMGFTLFLCGIGLWPAALLHLVAHSFYKAHAFLTAGSTVDVARASANVARPHSGERSSRPLGAVVGLAVASVAFVGVAWGLGFNPVHDATLLLVGAVVVLGVAQLVSATFDARGAITGQVVLLSVGVALAFFLLESLMATLLASSSLPATALPGPFAMAVAAVVVATWTCVALIQLTGIGVRTPLARRLRVHIRHGLYTNAAFDRLVGGLR